MHGKKSNIFNILARILHERPRVVVRAGFCPHPNPLPEGEGEEGALSSLPSPFGRGTEGEGGELRTWAHLGAPAHSPQGNHALCYPVKSGASGRRLLLLAAAVFDANTKGVFRVRAYRCTISTLPHLLRRYSATSRRWQL